MRGVKEFTIRASRADDAVLATFISGSLHAQLAAGLGFAAEAGDDEVAGGHVVGESERVAFEGELARPGANASRLLVGKLDRSTGTLHVVQVGWQCGLELRVKVPGAVVAARDPAAAPLRKRELVDEFGSKKAQKKQRAEALRIVDADKVADGAALEADLAEVGAAQAVSLAAEATATAAAPVERAHLPRYDLNTTDPIEAYPLDAIVPQQLWGELPSDRLLRDLASADDEAALAALASHTGRDGNSVAASPVEIAALRRTRDEAASVSETPAAKPRQLAEVRSALYLRHLLSFFALSPMIKPPRRNDSDPDAPPSPGGRARGHPFAEKAGIPEGVWALLIERFTEPTIDDQNKPAHRRTDACSDRLACHALALLLRLSRNALRVEAAVEALKVPKTKLAIYLRELGCTVGAVCPAHGLPGTQVAGARYAELKLPLTFPAIKKKVQRAGR